MSAIFYNGGPAFPSPAILLATDERSSQRDGMSLRAYLAGQALMGLLADTNNISSPEVNAQGAVRSADALIAELTKGPTL